MLIPVQVIAQLFTGEPRSPERIDEAIGALNRELSEFFAGAEVEAVGLPRNAPDANVTKTETLAGAGDGPDTVVVTLVLALRNITAADAQDLLETFTSQRFPAVTLTPASEAQLGRLRGLGAFANSASIANDNAASRISGIAEEP